MSKVQSAAARERWRGLSADERRAAVRPAIEATLKRRRTAFALLGAAEAAGLKIELPDDSEEAT